MHFIINFFNIICFLFLSTFSVYSTNNLPTLNCYNKTDYKAGRQNWDIDIDKDGIVYFANTEGLLYNIYGEWKLKKSPNKGLIRSVLVNNDTIWCAGKEFGYFTKNLGDLNFHKLGVLDYEQAWQIIPYKSSILFLTETKIIEYDKIKKTSKTHKFKLGFWSLTKWNSEIWAVQKNGEIGTIKNGVFKEKTFPEQLKRIGIRNIFIHNELLYIITHKGKLYSYDGQKTKLIPLPASLKGKALFKGMSFDDDSYCLGTVSEGFIRINNKGEILNHVDSNNGLLDNTVLSMKKDPLGNIWLGLDYGIAKLELQGPINKIFDGAATYDIKNFKEKTYVASNKGLYCSTNDGSFQFIENSGGQIWSLDSINNDLYACSNIGLSKIVNTKMEPAIIDYTGVYNFANFEGTDYFLFCTYSGILLIKKTGEQFNYVKNLKLWGCKKLIYDKLNKCIWGEFINKTIYKFTIDSNSIVKSIKNQTFLQVFDTQNGIYFTDNNNAYKYIDQKEVIATHELLKNIAWPIHGMAFSNNGYLCYLKDKQVRLSILLPDGTVYSYNNSLTSLGNNAIANFEYLDFDNNIFRLATDRGITTFNLNYKSNYKRYSNPVISSFTVLNEKNKIFHLPRPHKPIILEQGNKDLKFRLAINKSAYDVVEYRYKLTPSQINWSEWDKNNEIIITQIKGGEYKFQIQSRVNEGIPHDTSLVFSIEKTWHQTSLVLIPVVIIIFLWLFGVIIVMTRINRKKLTHQKNIYIQRENEQTLEIKNNQLLQFAEIISRKNEFLNKVKTGLEGMKNNQSKRWIRLISNEVNNEKKDFLFHKLFSEIHQDFISKITKNYPSLTANDIRVLSFIRINLDKHEICNLMNISPRSLDTNRYRIRKKMNLPQGSDLNQFIRDF